MLKGCKKNVVFVKNTGSDMFESAYFIVADEFEGKRTENDMLKEAKRIISTSPVSSYFSNASEQTDKKTKMPNRAAWFILGAVIMASINALIYFLI